MNAQLGEYAECKDSGVAWLGRIPAHWRLSPLKRASGRFFSGGTPDSGDSRNYSEDDEGIPWLVISDLTRQRKVFASAKRITERGRLSKNLELVPPGTLLYSMYASLGTCSILNIPATINQAIIGISPDPAKLDAEYLHYLLEVVSPNVAASANSSTQANLNAEIVRNIPTLLPSLDEQAAIVKYLAHVDRKIDRFVRSKRRMIELLNEQKQAIIHQAVTKGLDPSVPMKDSGVEWLREIPAHWETPALGYRYTVELGKMLDAKRIVGTHLVPYLRNTDVQWDRINVENLPEMDIAPSEYDRYTLCAGDLLVCEGGEVGRAAFWKEDLPLCGFQKALHRIRARSPEKDNARYLYFLLFSLAKSGIFAASGNESTIVHLTGVQLRAYRIPSPSLREQEAIAGYIDHEVDILDQAIDRVLQEIGLVREYRTRLISDVVTGKIDVREAAAPLPEFEGVASPNGQEDEFGANGHEDAIELEEDD